MYRQLCVLLHMILPGLIVFKHQTPPEKKSVLPPKTLNAFLLQYTLHASYTPIAREAARFSDLFIAAT